MARTISQIYNEMATQKAAFSSLTALQPNVDDAQTLLSDLSSTSPVGRWRLLLWIAAFGIYTHEVIVEQMLAAKIPPTLLWRKQRCLAFQYGDDLVEDNGSWVYNPVVPANRIVAYCSVKQDQTSGIVTVKVGKDDGAGNPTPLSTAEFDAFQAFLLVDGTEGTKFSPITSNPDTFKVAYNVYYDPAVMDSTGALIADGTKPVEEAIKSYLKNLPFDGLFIAEQLDTKVNAATGVNYAQRTVCQAKVGSNPYTNIQTLSPSIYQPFAGYGRISTASGETLADLINYIPNPQQVN
jgi:hypothetical protein